MDLAERVNILLSKNPEDVISSGNTQEIRDIYSALFKCNTLRTCDNSARQYFFEIYLSHKQKLKEMEEIKARTCKPNWGKGCTDNNGLKFIHAEGNHYSSLHITDTQAISLLNRGLLNESDFDVLPEGFNKPLPKFEETPEPKKEVKKRTPKA